jgi:hypothetical protein
MSSIEKLMARFVSKPKDFSWGELVRLLNYFGYTQETGSGSRRRFVSDHYRSIILHEPHLKGILKMYQLNLVYEILKEEKLI